MYKKLIESIINQTERIIGPVAIMQAKKVNGLRITTRVAIKGDPQKILKELLKNYRLIIGDSALTIAKKGAESILKNNPKLKVPNELRQK